MKDLTERVVNCPHCGHHLSISLDTTEGNQDFYDDCPSCCNPIHINMLIDDLHKTINVYVDADDEQIF